MRSTWAQEFSGGSVLVVVGGLLLAVAGIAATASTGVEQREIAIGFGALIALGELVRVNLPGDRSAAPLGAAAALAYALLGSFRQLDGDVEPTEYGVLQVVAVCTIAVIVGAVPHMAVGHPPRLESLARRVLVAGLAALLFRPLYTSGELDGITDGGWQLPTLMLVIVLVCGVADAVLAALARAGRDSMPFGAAARDEFRALLGIGSAIGARGDGLLGLAAVHAAAAGRPVLVPAVRQHPGDLPADHPRAVARDRGRWIHRERACAARGTPVGRGRT